MLIYHDLADKAHVGLIIIRARNLMLLKSTKYERIYAFKKERNMLYKYVLLFFYYIKMFIKINISLN